MSRRVPLARRQLAADRRRSVLAVGGVAVALLLALVLDGIFAGATRQVTAYLRASPADVIVSQAGVRTMHMSASALPGNVAERAATVDGVAWIEPVAYTSALVAVGDERLLAYVIGTAPGHRGGPSHLTAGRQPGEGEAVLDRVAAKTLGVDIGDTIGVAGRPVRISGLTAGLTSVANTTVFVSAAWFNGAPPAYLLIGADRGVLPDVLAGRLERVFGTGVEVQTRAAFVASEAAVVADMSADILRIMSSVAFAIALAVVALATYTATVARLRDIAVLKALGAPPVRLAAVTAGQAAWTVAVALIAAVAAAVLVGVAVTAVNPAVSIVVDTASVRSTASWAAAAAALGAVIPVARLATVDPATAFGRAT